MLERKIFVVLGVHRGGTSLASAALSFVGVPFGEALMPSDEHNPTGYWEDLDFVSLNEQMLRWLGLAWHALGPIRPNQVDELVAAGFQDRAVKLLVDKLAGRESFGFKDPRTIRLLDFWLRVFSLGNYDVRFLLVTRDPRHVCASISQRDGFGEDYGAAIWLEHILPAIKISNTQKAVLIDYIDFVGSQKHAEDTLKKLCLLTGAASASIDHRRFINEFIKVPSKKGLGGSNSFKKDVREGWSRNQRVFGMAVEAYSIIRADQMRSRKIGKAALEAIEKLWDEYRCWYDNMSKNVFFGKKKTTASLYIKTVHNFGFSESARISASFHLDGAVNRLEFSGGPLLDLDHSERFPVRLDPLETAATEKIVFVVFLVEVADKNGAVIRDSRSASDGRQNAGVVNDWFADIVGVSYIGKTSDGARLFVSESDDPQFRLNLAPEAFRALCSGGSLRLEIAAEAVRVKPTGELDRSVMKPVIELFEHASAQADERESGLRALEADLSQSREQLARVRAESAEWRLLLDQMGAELSQVREVVKGLRAQDEERESWLRALEADLSQSREQLAGARAESAERQRLLDQMGAELGALGSAHELRLQLLSRAERELLAIKSSYSWRLTAPMRFLLRPMSTQESIPTSPPQQGLVRRVVDFIVPVFPTARRKIGAALFLMFPKFFFNWPAYRHWKSVREESSSDIHRAQLLSFTQASGVVAREESLGRLEPPSGNAFVDIQSDYVPIATDTPISDVMITVIAFYLPQFHPILENDQWWGAGFTEWTNVTKATPQFEGHYQPHFPGELGYYDLRVPDVQARQVALAKLYGVGAFCFYFYWFGGKRLLERPILQFLNDKKLDLSFCLCWANENWSRRWDGLDQEILISQSHSKDDDIAFISYISKYLLDPRYLRIDGKPVLLVYRPSELPSASETAATWREWCRDNGVGEIYLAYTQSFTAVDPLDYGFDGAVEFPPNNSAPPDVTHTVKKINPAFSGTIYDWKVFVERSRRYSKPKYDLYRGVSPSWDNEARKPGRGTVFVGSTPREFEEWVYNASVDTIRRFARRDRRLVFVNAWNEWAEGAHLEPDKRYGYAWLDAVRRAQLRILMRGDMCRSGEPDFLAIGLRQRRRAIAVIVHLFYEDVFDEISGYIDKIPNGADLFFSVRRENFHNISAKILERFPDAIVVAFVNRGRDVLPFLHIMRLIRNWGYTGICKIHSKRSKHRDDGDVWRRDLLNKLLGDPALIVDCLTRLREGRIGVLAPAGHLLDGATYWGSNAAKVTALAVRMGCPPEWTQNKFCFPAGTMFWCTPDAMFPLLQLDLATEDFEFELGQVDATTAHAFERLVYFSARLAGLSIEETPTARGGQSSGRAEYQFASPS
jgi:lipopolysaccharide biosynthesis protein